MNNSKNNTTIALNQGQSPQLDAFQVKDYLLANPDFFNQYPILLEQLRIPHQKRGTVSLVELQSQQMREKVTVLQEQINQLMLIAQQNERIYRLYAELNLALCRCTSVEELLATLQTCIKQQFALSAVALKIFTDQEEHVEDVWRQQKQKRLSDSAFFFGRLTQSETETLFADVLDDGETVESLALMTLGDTRSPHCQNQPDPCIGMMAIGSSAAEHFSPEMDTLLMTQLQQLMTLLVDKLAMQGT